MALHGGGQRPGIKTIRAETDRTASSTCPKGQHAVKTIEEERPALLRDKPGELGTVGLESRLGKPSFKVAQGGLPDIVRYG